MGAPWSIKVAATNELSREAVNERIEAAFAEIERVEAMMSEWRPDSPISKINAAAGSPPIPVPAELRDIILRSIELSRQSNGAFDITWKGIGDLWQWSDTNFTPPDQPTIQVALERVDYRNIVVTRNSVGLMDSGMQIGLGGIAKGYGVDRAALKLRQSGLNNFMVNGGGDIYVAGLNFGRPWRLGIRHPRKGRQTLLAALDLSDAALVTSGDYEQGRIIDGQRIHHILDPRTGAPAQPCQSVSVIAPTAESADALATTVFILGPEEGLKLIADRPDTDTLIVDQDGRLWMTPGFKAKAQFRKPSSH